MHTLKQDLKYALRLMAKSPGFTLIAVLALALGIGANTAIFSVVNSALLRSLPYPNADRLVMLFHSYPSINFERASIDPLSFHSHRNNFESFESLAAFTTMEAPSNLSTGSGLPQFVSTLAVTDHFFQTLGVNAALGRVFTPEDSQVGRANVLILGYPLWQKRFGGDRNVIGQKVMFDGEPFEVVGVMPKDFQFPPRAEAWVPLDFTPAIMDPNGMGAAEFLNVFGKLKPGTSFEQVQAEATARAASIREESKITDANTFTLSVATLQDYAVGNVRSSLWVLLGAVGLVLLIACVNIANLLLARGSARQKEIAVRAALGASRGRMVRQLLTESLLLALLGGTCGLVLGYWGVDVLVAMAPDEVTQFLHVTVDTNVLWFTLGISLLTGFIFGLVPALHSSDPNLNEQLAASGRNSGAAFGRGGIRGALIAGEVAIAIVLLIGAGLLIRSFDRLSRVDVGFDPRNLISSLVIMPDAKYQEPERRLQLARAVLEQMSNAPGVTSAGLTTRLPMGDGGMSGSFDIVGRETPPGESGPHANIAAISHGYMKTMGITIVRGRGFEASDRAGSPDVVIVDERVVQRFFPDGDAVGKRINLSIGSNQDRFWEIVGVARAVRDGSLSGDIRGTLYLPYEQSPFPVFSLVARTGTTPEAMTTTMASVVSQADPDQAVARVRTMDSLLDRAVAPQRFNTVLLGAFAAIALLLASLGLYGVMSYSVSRRTQEIGIRMALGAGKADVLRLVIGQGMKLVLAGVAIGVVLAFGATRFLQSLLFGVGAADPATFIAIPLLLSAVAFLAAYIPARYAASVNPTAALRYE